MARNTFSDSGDSNSPYRKPTGPVGGDTGGSAFQQQLMNKLSAAGGGGNSNPYANPFPNRVNPNSLGNPTQQSGGPMYGPPIYDAQGNATIMGQIVPDVWPHTTPNPLPGPVDPYQQLQQQLMEQLNAIQVQQTPIEKLRAAAEAAASREYDPQISGLEAEIKNTQGRAQTGQTQSRDMYNALAQDLANQLPNITQQYKQAEDATAQRYDQAMQQMQGGFQQQQNQQQDILNRLGIQAAMGDPSMQRANQDQQYFQNQFNLSKQQNLDALNQMQNTDTGYNQKMQGNTRLAGENRAQDIGRDLESYMTGANAKMGSLRAGKASAIEQLIAQLEQQDAARVSQSQQNAFQQAMAMNNFGLDMLKTKNQSTQADNDLMLKLMELQQKQNSGFGNIGGIDSATNYLARVNPQDQAKSQQLMDIFNKLLMSPDIVSGKQVITDPGTGQKTNSPITNEYAMNRLREMALQNKLGGNDINTLMNMYQLYSKR